MDDTAREERLARRRESYRRCDAKRRQTPEYKARMREYHREWRLKNRERLLAEARARHADNPEVVRKRQRKWRSAHPDKMKANRKRDWVRTRENAEKLAKKHQQAAEWRAKNQHKIEVLWRRGEARKEAARAAIAGRPRADACDICGITGSKIVYDHCHRHGHFRGWICDRCNTVLGRVEDSADLLRKLIAYLRRTAKAPAEQFPLPGV
jgi:hypothetical protein